MCSDWVSLFSLFLLSFLADLSFRKGTVCDPCVAHKIKCAATPEDAKNKKSRRKKADEEDAGAGEASEPKWVDEMFEVVEALGWMLSDMDREDKKWKKKIEKRLDEMQESLDEINVPETEGESEKESEKKDKGKGKEKEKGPEGDGDVDMGS